jgi:hypothetical protein
MEITCPTYYGEGLVKGARGQGTGIIATFPVKITYVSCNHGDKRGVNCGGPGKIKK